MYSESTAAASMHRKPQLGRQLLDISGLALWVGPATGMTRVESQLARWSNEAVETVVYDTRANAYRAIRPAFRDILTSFADGIDPRWVSLPVARSGWRQATPSLLDTLMALEVLRLRAGDSLGGAVDRLQRALVGWRGSRFPLVGPDGVRYAYHDPRRVLGPPIRLMPEDRILASAADWGRRDAQAYARYIGGSRARLSVLCYDLLPITHPQYFASGPREQFAAVWCALLPVSERVIVTAECVAHDVAALAKSLRLPPPQTFRVRLGADPPGQSSVPLPAGRERGRFVLYVSTIEPRKNHALLMRVWRRLVRRGWPQQIGAHLVFVGRPGWMVDGVLAELNEPEAFAGTLHWLRDVDDVSLARLYEDCAFALYPSRTEGYGLPVVEAFAHGKAVLASSGGSLPEVIDGTAPLLDPDDAAAWERMIVTWFEQPAARAETERLVAQRNADPARAPDWRSAASALLSAGGFAQ